MLGYVRVMLQCVSDTSFILTVFDFVLQLISNASRYSGLIVSLQATCLVKSQLNVRLRGQPPYDELQSCLLLKVSGTRSCKYSPA